jgi:methanogen homoisocitrate dehydrogenase
VHGSAPDIAGKNLANPIAAIRSASMLLAYLGDPMGAGRIEAAIHTLVSQGTCTRDLGGSAGTKEFGAALIGELSKKR